MGNTDTQMPGVAPGQEISPEMKESVRVYWSMLSNMMHAPESRSGFQKTLGAYGDPYLDVPNTTKLIMDKADMMIAESGAKPAPLEAKFLVSQNLVGDIIDVGRAVYKWEITDADIGQLYQDSLQHYIEEGLADKSIDVMELQEKAEALMTPEQREAAIAYQKQAGIPDSPDPRAITMSLRNQNGGQAL